VLVVFELRVLIRVITVLGMGSSKPAFGDEGVDVFPGAGVVACNPLLLLSVNEPVVLLVVEVWQGLLVTLAPLTW
jgi:hypothetical protein